MAAGGETRDDTMPQSAAMAPSPVRARVYSGLWLCESFFCKAETT
jgi:hypothetical protein